jgi:hypothetical protein
MWKYLGIGLRGMNEIFYKMNQHRHQQQVFEKGTIIDFIKKVHPFE